jgi:hypothetical protein
MKLEDFGMVVRTTGIIYLLLLSVNDVVYIPLSGVMLIIIGNLCSAIPCKAKLLSLSFEHHALVNYFIAFLGLIIIMKHYSAFSFITCQ